MNYQGYIIYRERVRRNWSQAGLCKGICTVSYLSKIESGSAEPSEEILRLLLARLNLETNREVEREAAGLAERGWELLLTGRRGQLRGLLRERDIERYRAVPRGWIWRCFPPKHRWSPRWNPAWTFGSWPSSGFYSGRRPKPCGSCPTHTPT